MRIAGRWRITEAELWDRDALNLMAPAFIEFTEDGSGSFGFIAVQGEVGCRGRIFFHLGDDSGFTAVLDATEGRF